MMSEEALDVYLRRMNRVLLDNVMKASQFWKHLTKFPTDGPIRQITYMACKDVRDNHAASLWMKLYCCIQPVFPIDTAAQSLHRNDVIPHIVHQAIPHLRASDR